MSNIRSAGVDGVNFGDPESCTGITPNPADCIPEFEEVAWVDNMNPYGTGTEMEMDVETGILSYTIPDVKRILVGLTLDRLEDNELVSRIRQQFLINSMECIMTNTSDSENTAFRVAPNPTSGHLSFSVPISDLSILDLTGKRQALKTELKSYDQIDVSHLDNGIYYLRGRTLEGYWVTKKIIVLR